MTKNIKKPAVRFKEFTDAWEQRKLGEILKVHPFKPYLAEPIDNGKYEVIQQGNDSVIGYADGTPFKDYEPTVLFGDHTVSLYKPQKPFFVATDGIKILSTIENFDGYFLYSVLEKYKPQSEGYKRHFSILKEQECFYTPNKAEQTQIGSYFRNLDNLITLHQRKLETLKKLKKSMLQKMFPQNDKSVPEFRFEGFTDAWEQREFSDIAQRLSATGMSSADLPSVEYEDVISEQGLLNKDVTFKGTQKTGIVFSAHNVLYGKLRPYLHNWLNPDFKGVAVGDWWVLNPINSDKNFIYRLIQSENFDTVANQSTGTKMPRADWKLVSMTEFSIPTSLEEQQQIGTFFRNLDTLIALHQRKLETLKKLKKSMLQKMFV